MLFNSLTFAAFFTVLLLLYTLIGSWSGANALLLVGAIFLCRLESALRGDSRLSTVMDWWLARSAGKRRGPRNQKTAVTDQRRRQSGPFYFFKYGTFVLANFQALLANIGIVYVPPEFSIILPVGISFYTFASLSYAVDVYRREIRRMPA